MARIDTYYNDRSPASRSYAVDNYVVQRDDGSGYRSFSAYQESEAINYYNSMQALDNQAKLIKQQDEQFRLQQENARRQQEQLRLQQENARRNASNTYLRSVPTPTPRPTSQPYNDPEYAEFQKWKMENDPQYIKFKQEKERKARIEREEAECKAKAEQEREERERAAAEIKAKKVGGVAINGVIWATRNVGAKGTFVNNPQDYGNYYTWEEAKNVCPRGWRLPTKDEFERLRVAPNQWTTINGVNGQEFGTLPNTIFLPAAGYRFFYCDGALTDVGTRGLYLSTQIIGKQSVCTLHYSYDNVDASDSNREHSFCVRCVAE